MCQLKGMKIVRQYDVEWLEKEDGTAAAELHKAGRENSRLRCAHGCWFPRNQQGPTIRLVKNRPHTDPYFTQVISLIYPQGQNVRRLVVTDSIEYMYRIALKRPDLSLLG